MSNDEDIAKQVVEIHNFMNA
jgi:hypothetical protein